MTGRIRSLSGSMVVSMALVALAAPAASAQAPTPAATPAQTAFLGTAFATFVNGRELWITSSTGSRLKARVTTVTPAGLTLTESGGKSQTVPFGDIARMQRVSHRVRTATIVGMSVGTGFGAIGAGFCDSGGCAATLIFAYMGIGAGIGALAGAIRNSANRDDDTVFEAGNRMPTVALTPIVSKTRKGAAVTITWR